MEFLAPALVACVFFTAMGVFLVNRQRMRHEERMLTLKGKSDASDGQWRDSQTDIAALKERVAVLERLITDEDRRVAGEISRLGADARR